MSDQIKHECGVAMVRLLKPLEYYWDKYGTWDWGLRKLYLLMEKQHNRGQDGAGLVTLKLQSPPGTEYLFRVRSNKGEPIKDLFKQIDKQRSAFIQEVGYEEKIQWIINYMPFVGEVMMGHLRYGTFGKNNINNVHPVLRRNNWKSKTLALQGNFNLTNVDEIFSKLVEIGQHPRYFSDTITVLEKVGHFLERQNEHIYRELRDKGFTKGQCTQEIWKKIEIDRLLIEASKYWDGGHIITGIVGHGDAFAYRDPWGIRPAFYYKNEEVVVVTSERPVIQTVFNAQIDEINEIPAGSALIIKRNGDIEIKQIREPFEYQSCSFERIYFSRGSDRDIYQERKNLGKLIVPVILKAIDNDINNTVFSYIPNTAETAFLGMMEEMNKKLDEQKISQIQSIDNKNSEKLKEILFQKPRIEKLAIKDIKLRTFITQDKDRNDLVEHVYDVTYGVVKSTDSLVVIDDSIVRGTTLKQSIIKILSRLNPRKIVIASSAPQIRYPDCYGIDMSNLENFIAFQAVINLLKINKKQYLIDEVYRKCLLQKDYPKEQIQNYVQELYQEFTYSEISKKITELVKPDDIDCQVEIVFQPLENLKKAIPIHNGDWYFSGNYPTAGGFKVLNTAFINYYEGKKNARSY